MKLVYRSIIASLLILGIASSSLSAQSNNNRSRGYRGSVSITDHFGVWVGGETSHGYMFNSKNYLGGGVGAFIFPNGKQNPYFGTLFAEYRHYLKDKPGTFEFGAQAGYLHSFTFEKDYDVTVNNAPYIEPTIGWSWRLSKGLGLNLDLGAMLLHPLDGSRMDSKVRVMPKLSFGIEF